MTALIRGRVGRDLGRDVGVGGRVAALGGELEDELRVDLVLERRGRDLLPLLRDVLDHLLALRGRDVVGLHGFARARLGIVELERLDRHPRAQLVLGDRDAVHPGHGCKVVPDPARRPGPDEEEDGDDHDEAEADVHVEVPASVVGVAASAAGRRLRGGASAKCHGWWKLSDWARDERPRAAKGVRGIVPHRAGGEGRTRPGPAALRSGRCAPRQVAAPGLRNRMSLPDGATPDGITTRSTSERTRPASRARRGPFRAWRTAVRHDQAKRPM